ncbi:MAG: MFS transporter [Oscillospiraceae bacterium]|nr:MFS transporter [Oscillospiraceae bacterium]
MLSILAVIYIVFISLGLPDSLFGVAWPVVHLDFGIAENFASAYSIITGVCTGGASFVAGKLLRKFGTPNVTFVSILMTVIGLIGTSFSGNIWVMMLFSVVLGYGAGAIDTGLNNYVSNHYAARHMNWLHCFWGIGVTVSPMIMSLFLKGETGSWRMGYRVIAAIQLFIALIVLVFLKKWKSLDDRSIYAETDDSDTEKVRIFSIKGVPTSILSLGFYCAMEFTVGTWGASYIVNTCALPPDAAAKWISAYYGGIMLGRLVAGFVSIKASDNFLIRCGLAISCVGFVLLALPLGTFSLCGFALIGFGFGPVFPSVLHSVPERFGSKLSADITGYHMGGAYAVGFAAQLVFGYTATATTFRIMPFVLAALCVCAFMMNEMTLSKLKSKKIGS